MYLRFVGAELDERTGKAKGIFTIAYDLLWDEELLDYEEDQMQEMLDWFKYELPIPTKFSRKKNVSYRDTQGISWVKESSREVISKMWELKTFLEAQDIIVEVQRTLRPGYVVYEDEHQVVAEPYHHETIDLL